MTMTHHACAYGARGHAKKLVPIIDSLNQLDFDPSVWDGVSREIEKMEVCCSCALFHLPHDAPERRQVEQLLAHAREALRKQTDLFASHRRVCVNALALRASSSPTL